MPPMPNKLTAAVRAASSDGRYWGAWPDGNKPGSAAALAGSAAAVASASGALASNAPDWNALLAKTGTGTPDATGFDPKTDITYLGAFKIPFLQNGVTNSREKRGLAFRPPEGSNGANGSVFLGGGGNGSDEGKTGGFSEHQIPTLGTGTTVASLPAATVLQNWFNCRAAAPIAGSSTATLGGWAKYIGGKLYMTYYVFYPGEYSTQNLLICNTPSNLAGSTYQGMLELNGADKVVRYCGEIPADKRSLFGGRTHFSGVTSELSIVARASFGNSFYSWTPGGIGSGDTSVASTEEVYFSQDNPHPWFSNSNQPVADHYGALVGSPLAEYVQIPLGSRLNDLSGLAQPSSAIRSHMIVYGSVCGVAFIPAGSNTIVFMGHNIGARYGNGYKVGTLELGPGESAGFYPFSWYDHDNVFWTMNINDVAAATVGHDVDYVEYGNFTADPWLPGLDHRSARIVSGDYDPTTGKLYLLQEAIPYNEYEDQHIVSVYQVSVP